MSAKDQVAVRLDAATLSRIDALKDVLTTPWHEATRSDILRALLLTGLVSKALSRSTGARVSSSAGRPRKVRPRRGPGGRADDVAS
jgi:hypothetical protein